MHITRTCTVTILLGAIGVLAGGCKGNDFLTTTDGIAAGASHVSAKHVLVMHAGSERVPPGITRTKAEAKARILQCLARYQEGAKFEDLAREYSDGPSATKGGDLGQFSRGMMAPPFERASFACEVGQVTDVVETSFGYHLIYRYR